MKPPNRLDGCLDDEGDVNFYSTVNLVPSVFCPETCTYAKCSINSIVIGTLISSVIVRLRHFVSFVFVTRTDGRGESHHTICTDTVDDGSINDENANAIHPRW